MVSPTTSRAAARAAQTATIKEVARRLVARRGVAGLSLREVAREMGVVSSALYRYFATRDDLLTALILDAYNDLGATVERADARHADASSRVRWRAVARALRSWALRHPHEFALIYGTPVPGYHAPVETIAAATRFSGTLARILNDDRRRSHRRAPASPTPEHARFLVLANVREAMPDVDPDDYVRALMAWTQLVGFVSFELFGHYVGSVRNAARMYDVVVEELADSLRLTGKSRHATPRRVAKKSSTASSAARVGDPSSSR